MGLSISTLSKECNSVECHAFILMLSVIVLNVVIQRVGMLGIILFIAMLSHHAECNYAGFCGPCYKTFYGLKLRLFIREFIPGKPFQPSLMFVVKARSLP
jgi:hypothetical protein